MPAAARFTTARPLAPLAGALEVAAPAVEVREATFDEADATTEAVREVTDAMIEDAREVAEATTLDKGAVAVAVSSGSDSVRDSVSTGSLAEALAVPEEAPQSVCCSWRACCCSAAVQFS